MLLIIVAILLFGISIFIFMNKDDGKKDYAPIDADPGVIKIDDGGKKSSSSGSKVSLKYKNKVVVDTKEKKLELFYENTSNSNQNVVLEIMASNPDDQDTEFMISKSGFIPVGYGIYELSLLDAIELNMKEYSGRMVVKYYDEKTGEIASVDTNIPILIEVE